MRLPWKYDHSEVAEESVFYEMAAKRHVGVLEQRRLHPVWVLFSQSFLFLKNGDKCLGTGLWREPSQQLDADSAVLLSQSGSIRNGGEESRRLVETWTRVLQKPDFCLCPSRTLLSPSLIKKKKNPEKKESSCLC